IDFVKHNPGVCVPASKAGKLSKLAKKPNHPTVTSWFFAQLVSQNDDNNAYVQYAITDQTGIPTAWHSINTPSINESKSNLFTTTFALDKDIAVSATDSGEVLIRGTDT